VWVFFPMFSLLHRSPFAPISPPAASTPFFSVIHFRALMRQLPEARVCYCYFFFFFVYDPLARLTLGHRPFPTEGNCVSVDPYWALITFFLPFPRTRPPRVFLFSVSSKVYWRKDYRIVSRRRIRFALLFFSLFANSLKFSSRLLEFSEATPSGLSRCLLPPLFPKVYHAFLTLVLLTSSRSPL